MMGTEYQNRGPIYLTKDKYDTLKNSGQLVVGQEYRIINYDDTVHYDKNDEKTSTQKSQARTNIGAQEVLSSGTNIKTINGQSVLGGGDLTVKTYQPFPNGSFTGTLQALVTEIMSFPGKAQGMAYLGEIYGSCVPFAGNAECKVEFMTDGIAVLSVSSSDIIPYHWEYNTASNDLTWKKYSDVIANPSESTSDVLSKISINGTNYNISDNTKSTATNLQNGQSGSSNALQQAGSHAYSDNSFAEGLGDYQILTGVSFSNSDGSKLTINTPDHSVKSNTLLWIEVPGSTNKAYFYVTSVSDNVLTLDSDYRYVKLYTEPSDWFTTENPGTYYKYNSEGKGSYEELTSDPGWKEDKYFRLVTLPIGEATDWIIHAYHGGTLGQVSHSENYCNTTAYLKSEVEFNEKTSARNHAEGSHNLSLGQASHVEGEYNVAQGDMAHVEGKNNISTGNHSHVEGNYNTASDSNAHAEGYFTTAYGYNSHSEGHATKANGGASHAEGYYTYAAGEHSHAEGEGKKVGNTISWTKANGVASHAEGRLTLANADYSHTEGQGTYAFGIASHAEGQYTNAKGDASHAGGIGTITDIDGQTAVGQYNYNLQKYTKTFEVTNTLTINGSLIIGSYYTKGSGDGYEFYLPTLKYRASSEDTWTVITSQLNEDNITTSASETNKWRFTGSCKKGTLEGWISAYDANTDNYSVLKYYFGQNYELRSGEYCIELFGYGDFEHIESVCLYDGWDKKEFESTTTIENVRESLFTVGIGDNDNRRANALEVLSNGTMLGNNNEDIEYSSADSRLIITKQKLEDRLDDVATDYKSYTDSKISGVQDTKSSATNLDNSTSNNSLQQKTNQAEGTNSCAFGNTNKSYGTGELVCGKYNNKQFKKLVKSFSITDDSLNSEVITVRVGDFSDPSSALFSGIICKPALRYRPSSSEDWIILTEPLDSDHIKPGTGTSVSNDKWRLTLNAAESSFNGIFSVSGVNSEYSRVEIKAKSDRRYAQGDYELIVYGDMSVNNIPTLDVYAGNTKVTPEDATTTSTIVDINDTEITSQNLFTVGNGTDETNTSNAFAVTSDGSIKIGNTKLTEEDLEALLALIHPTT